MNIPPQMKALNKVIPVLIYCYTLQIFYFVQDFPTRSDIKCAVQLQKRVKGIKFGSLELEESHYLHTLCAKNKGADQLH